VWHNRNLFRRTLPDLVTLPEYFKDHGYHTQSLGKVFSGNAREAEQDPQSWSVPPLLKRPGWSNYALEQNQGTGGKGLAAEMAVLPDEGYSDGKLAALAVETLEGLAKRKRPFFLAVGFFKPHLPFCAPKKYWDLYDPADFELAPDDGRTLSAPDVAYHEHHELGGYRDVPKDEQCSARQARHLRRGYYACVSYVDAQVGKLLDAVNRFDLEKNTIVVFWGDHGYSLGEAGRWCKGTNFEVDTRAPLIFRLPGMPKPGISTEALVEYVDIYPTVVELAGLLPAPDLDGTSLVPILNDPNRKGRRFVLSQFSRPFHPAAPDVMGYSIRTQAHRYTRWVRRPSREIIAEEFYDYTSVPSTVSEGAIFIERKNVVSEAAYRELRKQLAGMMDQTLQARTGNGLDGPTGEETSKTRRF
jgi:arylsulfatase A-like enzyme